MPSTYEERIHLVNTLTLDDICSISKECLPPNYRDIPWTYPGLDHGRALLQDNGSACAYMVAYGDVHRKKVMTAFQNFPFNILSQGYEIVDWGCGQALGSICFLDIIRDNGRAPFPNRISLIEPSEFTLNRAILHVQKACSSSATEVVGIQKYLPSDRDQNTTPGIVENIDVSCPICIHLFSNILDIESVSLKKVANIIGTSNGKHFVICMGPTVNAHRFDLFSRYFNLPTNSRFLNISDPYFGQYPSGKAYTARILCFLLDVRHGVPALIPYSFYPPKQMFASYKLDSTEAVNDDKKSAFEVLAPFDLGASIHDDVDPILAVLSNIISRGWYTKASPFIENFLSNVTGFTQEENPLGSILFKKSDGIERLHPWMTIIPISVARIQKVIVEAMICGRIDLHAGEWNILVKEIDVPCAALAIEDLRQMYNHLCAMSEKYSDRTFPRINLTVISERTESRVHLDANVKSSPSQEDLDREYDMVIDYSYNEFCDARNVGFSEFRAKNKCYFNVRSSNEIYEDRTIYTTDRIKFKPVTRKDERGVHVPIEENVTHLRYFLQLLFRKQDFRDGQLPILNRALQLESVIGLLPTGGGKSLTYQLAAMLQPGISIVIDPLTSLMKDQYDGLIKNGVDCCTFINSTVDPDSRRHREAMLTESKIQILFVSPERLCIYSFRDKLKAMAEGHIYFAYGVIDEVHCVSEWGHDFRFSYLHLGRNLYNYVLPKQSDEQHPEHISLFGLTATASFDVLSDVERELSGNSAFPLDPDATVRYENTNRLELQYRVKYVPAAGANNVWDVRAEKNREAASTLLESQSLLRDLLDSETIQRIRQRFIERENITDTTQIDNIYNTNLAVDVPQDWHENNNAAAIVFCPHRQGSIGVNDSGNGNQGVARSIGNNLPEARISTYVGGDNLTEQDRFLNGDTNIMVATKAFGMGIDKPNVRFTLNMNHSGSLEAFIQEAGRAGRDRRMALATILYSDNYESDRDVHQFFHDNSFRGDRFEKAIMFYLMSQQTMNMSVGLNQNLSQTSQGFMGQLMSSPKGTDIVSFISYDVNGPDYRHFYNWLSQINPPLPIPGKPKEREDLYVTSLEKAIYRMCCIGVIDDFTRDYSGKTFRIVTESKTDEDYYDGLKRFLMRYYTEDRANQEVVSARNLRGENAIQKCLGYLTGFVYDKIASKRMQAIDDMETFCQEAISSDDDWKVVNENLKDFIYYYFNSKYAREGHTETIGNQEVPYSLTDETKRGKFSSPEIVFKYMGVIDDALVSPGGTPKDNIMHLQGAVRLIRRALTEPNPTLDFLNVFCLLFLNSNNATSRAELKKSYIEGYCEFAKRADARTQLKEFLNEYKNHLMQGNIITSASLTELEKWEALAEVKLNLDWLTDFRERFVSENNNEI